MKEEKLVSRLYYQMAREEQANLLGVGANETHNYRPINKQHKIKPRAERVRSSVHDSCRMEPPRTSMWREDYNWNSWEHRYNKRKSSVMDGGVG